MHLARVVRPGRSNVARVNRLRPLLIALPFVALTGCARSDSVDSVDVDETTTTTAVTVAETSTSVPETTTSIESTTTVAETTTTVAATTTVAETTTTAVGSSTTIADGEPVDTPESAFVAADQALLEVDVASGAVDRVLDEFFTGDGVFRGELRLTPDRSTLWYSEGYEDGWYGCDSSVGSFGRVDVASGSSEVVGTGVGPEPSPDDALVAYVTTELCLPDPENPEFWVLTPYDRAVVRDVTTGEEREFVTDPAPDDYSSPSQVEWAGFRPNGRLLVLTTDGQLRLVDVDGSSVLQDHPVLLDDVRGFPVGTTRGALVTVDFGDEGSADLYSIDTATGAATLLASSEGFMTAGVSFDGAIVVTAFADVTVEPGAQVTVLTPPDDATYYDVDW